MSWPQTMILTYHEVLPAESSLSRYSVSCEQFESHLKFAVSCSSPPRIVFDDGDRSNFDYALPILNRHQISATFFVTAGFVDHHPQTMTWNELRELVRAGHSVQAHGWSHRFLTQCTDTELRHELAEAKDHLESKLGRAVTEVSFPGGRFNDRVLALAAEAGYHTAYTSQPWSRPPAASPLLLRGRVMVRRNTYPSDLQRLIDQRLAVRMQMYGEHCLRTGIRNLVGEGRYDRVWRKFARREEALTSTRSGAAAHSVARPALDEQRQAGNL